MNIERHSVGFLRSIRFRIATSRRHFEGGHFKGSKSLNGDPRLQGVTSVASRGRFKGAESLNEADDARFKGSESLNEADDAGCETAPETALVEGGSRNSTHQ